MTRLQVATLRYLADHTSIPVPSVLVFHRGSDGDQSTPCYALLQKVCVHNLQLDDVLMPLNSRREHALKACFPV